MAEETVMKVIAHAKSDFTEKFGIPRQSGMVDSLKSVIVFEPEYRNIHAFRGIEEFSYLWLIWEFSEAHRTQWSPTVRPPRLGGNVRKGVFATRSPFRPNPIGLSCVRLERLENHPKYGPVLHVCGADLLDGTPIFDVKPYLPHVESHPLAQGGFAQEVKDYHLEVEFPQELLEKLPEEKWDALKGVLTLDPRPAYQEDPTRIYGVAFAGWQVRFQVEGNLLKVVEMEKVRQPKE